MRYLLLAAALLSAAACKKSSSGDDDGDDQPIDAPPGAIDGARPDGASVTCTPVDGKPALTAQTVASGLTWPVFATAPKNDPRLFILEKASGNIKILKNGSVLPTPFLTLDVANGIDDAEDERGLLGLTFAPDYETSGYFYVFYVNNGNDEAIDRFQVSSNPDVADPDSRTPVWSNSDPASNHNGGTLAFSPVDGYLYFGVGDGGGAGDTNNNAQTLEQPNLLGKMNRIDVSSLPYTIPADNPFVGVTGTDEIWSYGLRNPYRWSFDRENGNMYIGDVGQTLHEEIDVEPAGTGGRNYGWRVMEGNACYNPMTGCDMTNKQPPIYDVNSTAIIGGYVYRGCAMPGWHGTYFFADYSGWVRSLVWDGANGYTDLIDQDGLEGGGRIVSFGEGGDGELYIVRQDGGTVQKIVPE